MPPCVASLRVPPAYGREHGPTARGSLLGTGDLLRAAEGHDGYSYGDVEHTCDDLPERPGVRLRAEALAQSLHGILLPSHSTLLVLLFLFVHAATSECSTDSARSQVGIATAGCAACEEHHDSEDHDRVPNATPDTPPEKEADQQADTRRRSEPDREYRHVLRCSIAEREDGVVGILGWCHRDGRYPNSA